MSASTLSFSAGGITLSGFVSNATVASGYTTETQAYLDDNNANVPSFWFNVTPHQGDAFVFNTTGGAGLTGSYTGPEVVTASGTGTTDNWSLNVFFSTWTGNTDADYVYIGAGINAASEKAGVGIANQFTVFGQGTTTLTSVMQSIRLHIITGDQVGLTFTLQDFSAPGGPSTSWTEYFAACFATGTRIATPSGESSVETLRIGDLVATSTGAAKPVKWVGRRTYTAAQIAANPQLRPVLVRRDALGAGMPHRDLTVSAMHSLLVDDAMVPAVSLVNGVTILRSDELAPVTYFHIELAEHDVVFAEGAPTETFIDDNSRLLFENADEFFDLYGAEAQAEAPMARLDEGYQLDAIRRRLAARAGATPSVATTGALQGHVEGFDDGVLRGWTVANGSTAAVELEVIADGETVARVIANRYRLDLDHAGIAGGIGGFTVALPASVTSLSQVSVRRVADGAALPQPQVAALVG